MWVPLRCKTSHCKPRSDCAIWTVYRAQKSRLRWVIKVTKTSQNQDYQPLAISHACSFCLAAVACAHAHGVLIASCLFMTMPVLALATELLPVAEHQCRHHAIWPACMPDLCDSPVRSIQKSLREARAPLHGYSDTNNKKNNNIIIIIICILIMIVIIHRMGDKQGGS